MKSIRGMILGLVVTLIAGTAFADTTYQLPDPSISVTIPASINSATVKVGGVYYSGPVAFYYLSECATPDTQYRHCNILEGDDAVLTAADGSTITVTLVVQSLRVLIRSGHNYWRSSTVLLDGTVTTP